MEIEFSTASDIRPAELRAVAGWRDDLGIFYAMVEGPEGLILDVRASHAEAADAAIVLDALRPYVDSAEIDAVAGVLAGAAHMDAHWAGADLDDLDDPAILDAGEEHVHIFDVTERAISDLPFVYEPGPDAYDAYDDLYEALPHDDDLGSQAGLGI
ncbi:hypothetical protein AB0A74_26450 [Saccharothrix sp. NPDC042600]|uniref:hypothetical protein n=1 Tax=Saccharothrix TaxID=2071 RepID=UPI0033EB34FE|nr:hypothetical protein GCM10017745_46260 [Saccharothrix mutabilis subsp. capreolus]